MKEIRYEPERSLAEEFSSKSGGFSETLTAFVESAPWIVSSVIFHLVMFAGLTLLTIGGTEIPGAVCLESVFEQTDAPEEKLDEPDETIDTEFTKTDDMSEEVNLDEVVADDPIDEEKIDGDPEAPADNPTPDDLIGALGLGGGSYKGIYSGRGTKERKRITDKIGFPEAETSVRLGLKWLADHQEPDGHWDAKKWGGYGAYDPGVTGLALLAFAGAGNTETTGRYKNTVRRAVKWLAEKQDASGNFAPEQTMYNHAIPTLALLEIAGMSPVPRTRRIAEKGVKYILASQNEYKAWRYWPKDNDNDVSVTTWCVMALKAAKVCKIDVPASAWEGVGKFLDEVTEPTYGEVGYTSRPIKGAAEQPYQKYSMTACGILCRLYMGASRTDRLVKAGVQILRQNLPEWNQAGIGAPFFYYWYYGSLALFQVEGEAWKEWNVKMREILTKHQIKEKGELHGSWDPPASHNFGQMGGRVYSTAMAVLTLEVYYRYKVISHEVEE